MYSEMLILIISFNLLTVFYLIDHYLQIRMCNEKYFSYFSSKTRIVDAQNNHLLGIQKHIWVLTLDF